MGLSVKQLNLVHKGIEAPKTGKAFEMLSRAFPLVPIANESHNRAALTVIERLSLFINEAPERVEKNDVLRYMKALATLVEDFESKNFPVKKPKGKDMLAFLMEQHDLKQRDLKEELGGQSVVSEILSGDRDLNVKQIKALSSRFKVDPGIFL